MAAQIINQENFENEVLKSDKTVIVDFFASWCGPCKVLSPVLEEISEENSNIKVCKVNIDNDPDLAMKYNVSLVPTLAYFKDGKQFETLVGVNPKSLILEKIS